jgi:predicted NUDIX family phosphoesterase
MTTENVLCFPVSALRKLGDFQGISLDAADYADGLFGPVSTFRPRPAVETEFEYKQAIPYILIVCGDKILRYRRGKRGDESRLHGKFSVGIGGHINDGDSNYVKAVMREICEEVRLDWYAPPVACINDDSTEVGRVHFGFVHICHVQNESITAGCASIADPEFTPIEDAQSNIEAFETWSQICLHNINKLLRV